MKKPINKRETQLVSHNPRTWQPEEEPCTGTPLSSKPSGLIWDPGSKKEKRKEEEVEERKKRPSKRFTLKYWILYRDPTVGLSRQKTDSVNWETEPWKLWNLRDRKQSHWRTILRAERTCGTPTAQPEGTESNKDERATENIPKQVNLGSSHFPQDRNINIHSAQHPSRRMTSNCRRRKLQQNCSLV